MHVLNRIEVAAALITLMVCVFLAGAASGMWSWAPSFWLIFWSSVVTSFIVSGRFAIVWFVLCALGCLWIGFDALGNDKWGEPFAIGFFTAAGASATAAMANWLRLKGRSEFELTKPAPKG